MRRLGAGRAGTGRVRPSPVSRRRPARTLLRSDQASYGLRVDAPAGMMRPMTQHRPWFHKWPADVPRTLEPIPELSLFRMLQDAAAGFPDKPATAFFGAHLSYRELLDQVE